MAKESLNIVDFSGGFNTFNDKRDIAENEVVLNNNLVSNGGGSLELAYGFLPVPNTSNVKGFQNGADLNNTVYFQPANHFIIYGIGQATSTSSQTVTVVCNTEHGLSVNTPITIVTSGSNNTYRANTFTVNSIDGFNFTVIIATAASLDEEWTWFIGGQIENDTGINPGQIIPDTTNNNIILQNNGFGRFGFFNIDRGYFYGKMPVGTNINSLDTSPWLFDTQYLWDFHQSPLTHYPDSGVIELTDTDYVAEDSFYTDGVLRITETHPKYFAKNHLRRPVGLYYIPEHNKFGTVDGILYTAGWYPLRTHCLSMSQIRTNTFFENNFSNLYTGRVVATTDSAMTAAELAGDIENPINSNLIHVGVGTSTAIGSFDFSDKYAKMGIGVSYVYDDIIQDETSYSQESNMDVMTTNGLLIGGETFVSMPDVGLKSLNLTIKIHKGTFADSGISNGIYNNSTTAIPQSRGEGVNDGFSNINAWNPRIVGANIYITQDADETYDDPILLAKFNFYGNESIHGVSQDHDGVKAESWVHVGDICSQTILNIESIPIMTYHTKNLYRYNENINTWYKTSAIVNRKLYAGNVSFFSDTNYLNMYGQQLNGESGDTAIQKHPDKIYKSVDINKFDILPQSAPIEISKFDGQAIVKLLAFNSELLIFKTNDLFVLDCSTELEDLKNTFFGKGLQSKHHVIRAGDFVFFMNKSGLYIYDGKSVANILREKIRHSKWEQIFDKTSQISYDSNYGLVIITTSYDPSTGGNTIHTANILYYNVATNAFFFKNKDSNYAPSDINSTFQIHGDLYAIAAQYNAGNEVLNAVPTTDFVAGASFQQAISITMAASGTWPGEGAGSAALGQLNTLVQHLKIKKSSDNKWTVMNQHPYYGDKFVLKHPSIAGAIAQNNAESLSTAITNQLHKDYTIVAGVKPREEDAGLSEGGELQIFIKAKHKGTAYNVVAQDLNSISSLYGETAIAFSGNTTESTNATTAGIAIGNIISYTKINDYAVSGVNRVMPVFRISPDRLGVRTLGTTYRLTFSLQIGTGTFHSYQIDYVIGTDYFTQVDDYDLLTMTSGVDNTNNNNLCSNIYQALKRGLLDISSESSSDLISFDFGAIDTSVSGSHFFNMTLLDSSALEYGLTNVWCFPQIFSPDENTAELLKWYNESIPDENDNYLSRSKIALETKDYDFGQPAVRKKVYKAYITYTGGDGEVLCYYQANQSGSFTKCTVLDSTGASSTIANTLNDSTNQTRAELTFGTGGNNIYSFALKFVSVGNISNFKINDLSIIYRLKKPK